MLKAAFQTLVIQPLTHLFRGEADPVSQALVSQEDVRSEPEQQRKPHLQLVPPLQEEPRMFGDVRFEPNTSPLVRQANLVIIVPYATGVGAADVIPVDVFDVSRKVYAEFGEPSHVPKSERGEPLVPHIVKVVPATDAIYIYVALPSGTVLTDIIDEDYNLRRDRRLFLLWRTSSQRDPLVLTREYPEAGSDK